MGLFDKMLKTRNEDHWSREKIEAICFYAGSG